MNRSTLRPEISDSQNKNRKYVYIILEPGSELPARLHEFKENLQSCFINNQFNILIDMKNVKLPPTKFIVALIEATSQSRRMGGELKLKNVNLSARNNIVTFSPRTYLSIEPLEKYAMEDFGETFDERNAFDIKKSSDKANQKKPIIKKTTLEDEQEKNQAQEDSVADNVEFENADKIRVQSHLSHLYEICDFVIERAETAGFDIRERGKIKVTVYEACLNVIEHAYFSNHDYWINVYVKFDDTKFIIVIQDWGQSFDFDPTPRKFDVEQAMKDRKTGGFGLHIIQRSVDEISYKTDPKLGNRLILVKYYK